MHTFASQQPPDIQALFSQFLAQLPAAQIEQLTRKSDWFPDIRTESRSHVPTDIAAHWLGRKNQTLRGWHCHGDYPDGLRPLVINSRLAWPVSGIKRALGLTA